MRRALLRSVMLWLWLFSAAAVFSQIAEDAEDPNGTAIPYPHLHLVHFDAADVEGTSAHLRAFDPFLFYQLGRDLTHRQYTLAHGALGQSGKMNVPMDVGTQIRHGAPARFGRDHTASCGMCHSIPYREPGGGQTIASTGGLGRNTPHFYGAGLTEMIARQIETRLMIRHDSNRNGRLERGEVGTSAPAIIEPLPGATPVDYGDLAPGPDGIPRLNPIFRLWFTDDRGNVLPEASSLDDPGVAAFGFAMQPFGWGRGYRLPAEDRRLPQGAEASTLREIFTVAADVHMGLQAHDPSQLSKRGKGMGGHARVSLNGAPQFDFGGSVDRGNRTRDGLSLDDPDGDGKINELTEGDLDAIEFYLLHTPPPAILESEESRAGRRHLIEIGCTRCHVETWSLEPADGAYSGDRRFFDFAVSTRTTASGERELVGRLNPLADRDAEGAHRPRRDGFTVRGIYTDLKHWDIGPAFHERRFDGRLQRQHRTAPLWGVGSTPPYGHAGQFPTLHAVIDAHAGAARSERDAYRAASPEERARLLLFLKSLILYQTEEIPSDIDGDGIASEHYSVAGQAVGYERFDARFLFERDPRWKILGQAVNADGRSKPLWLLENTTHLYRLDSPARRDRDGDGFPDFRPPSPEVHRE